MKRRAFVGKYANAQDPFDYAAQLCLRRSAQGDRVSFYVILRSRGIAARIEGASAFCHLERAKRAEGSLKIKTLLVISTEKGVSPPSGEILYRTVTRSEHGSLHGFPLRGKLARSA